MKKVGQRVQLSLYVDLKQRDALAHLSKVTRVPQQVYLREAVDDLLAKYKTRLRGRK